MNYSSPPKEQPDSVLKDNEELVLLRRRLKHALSALAALGALFVLALAAVIWLASSPGGYRHISSCSNDASSSSSGLSSSSAGQPLASPPPRAAVLGQAAPGPVRGPAFAFLFPTPRNVSNGTTTVRLANDFYFTVPGFDDASEEVPAPFARVRRAAKRYANYIRQEPGAFVTAAWDMDAIESNETEINRRIPVIRRAVLSCGTDEPGAPLHTAVENYTISVPSTSSDAMISADTWVGCLRGLETFSQLVVRSGKSVWTRTPPRQVDSDSTDRPLNTFPLYIQGTPLIISDAPYYAHRGLSLDTARHHMELPDLKHLLQAMSFSKFNVLHWHLADSQSFPIQLENYPELTKEQPPIRIYTERDITDLVNEASDLGIRVIPELDVPGHSLAIGRSIPNLVVCPDVLPWSHYANQPPSGQLDVSRNETTALISGIFSELARLFKDPLIHLGSDEINSACYQDFLPGYSHSSLQSFFTSVFSHLQKLNKTPVQWEDAILAYNLDIPNSTILQIWGQPSHALDLARRGFSLIMSPNSEYYLDCGLQGNFLTGGRRSWCDPMSTSVSMYLFDPNPNNLSQIIGGEVALWAETADGTNLLQAVFARAIGAAGRWWQHPTTLGGTKPNAIQLRRARMNMAMLRERMVQRGVPASPLWMQWCSDGYYCVDDDQGVVEI